MIQHAPTLWLSTLFRNTFPAIAKESLAQRLKSQAKDMHEYQQLKVADDMERDATARYKETLKRKYGEAGAEAIMREKGFDPGLLK